MSAEEVVQRLIRALDRGPDLEVESALEAFLPLIEAELRRECFPADLVHYLDRLSGAHPW